VDYDDNDEEDDHEEYQYEARRMTNTRKNSKDKNRD